MKIFKKRHLVLGLSIFILCFFVFDVGFAQTPKPTVSISAKPMIVEPGGDVSLTWSSTDATKCYLVINDEEPIEYNVTYWNNMPLAALYQETKVSLYCEGPGGKSDSRTVVISLDSNIELNTPPLGDEVDYSNKNESEKNFFGLVPCGTEKYEKGELVKDGIDMEGAVKNPCDFNYFMKLINDVMNFILVQLAVPLSALMFAYAGGILLFSGGSEGKRSQAKKIFTNVAVGLIIVAGAWLIIHSILSLIGYNGSWIGF